MANETALKNWIPALITVTASLAGMLYVTGVFASSDGTPISPPGNFHEVRPMNRCGPGEGAGSRAAQTIFRGARPDASSLRYLEAIGVRSIMDLEMPGHISAEEKLEAGLGIPMHELEHPMSIGMGVNELPDGTPDDESIIRAVAELRNAQNFPVYVHCAHGDDRTGLVVALHRVFDECWAPKDAEAEWDGIAGFWHDLWNKPKHDYFHRVMEDPNLHQRYVDELNQLAPAGGRAADF